MKSNEKTRSRFVIAAAIAAMTTAAVGAVIFGTASADGTDVSVNATNYVEGLPMLYVGETLQLSAETGAIAMSDNTSVARVSSSGKITAVGYGKATISVETTAGNKEITLIVKDRYDAEKTVGQRDIFPAKQGENGFYVYNSDNGDIENDLDRGLTALGLMSEQYYNGSNGWWNNVSFIGNDHFGGRGAGALSFKASYPGNYTVDYSAWLLEHLRTDPDYNGWNVDGFSTGLAKKTAEGDISVLVSNVGTKQSVVADKTRYQTGSVTVDLAFGDELMMFFCSNGNGDCDEVYTEFFVTTNSVTGEPLYTLPADVQRFDGDIKIVMGGALDLALRQNAVITSSNTSAATVDATGRITGVGYGATEITVKDGDERASFMLVVDRQRPDATISLSDNLPAKQGDNNLYIYSSANGNYREGLPDMQKVPDSASAISSWSTPDLFVNSERVFCDGTNAVAFEAPSGGTYTVDYYAYLDPMHRNNPLYLTEWDTDGFTTGLAKRSATGEITTLIVNEGTKHSVVDAATCRQMGTVSVDLERGEQIMFFFASNQTANCDEIKAGFYVMCDSDEMFDGNVAFPAGTLTVNDAALLYSGDTIGLQTSFVGRLEYASSDEAIAAVDENGKITAKGVGSAVITVRDAFKTVSRVVVVRNRLEKSDVIADNTVPTKQGDKNLRVYTGANGDIENDLASGLKDIPLMGENYYFAGEAAWWDNQTYLNAAHVFTRGVGILGYTVSEAGSYRLDYLACLMPDIYYNPDYTTNENHDGFTVGLMCKKANGDIEIIASDIHTRFSLVADETRMSVKERVYKASAGDELCFFWVSNGNGDSDEIYYKFALQRVYESEDERPTEITFGASSIAVEAGEVKQLNFDVAHDHGAQYEWSSGDPDIVTVTDGKIQANAAGSCVITLKVGSAQASIVVYVTERLTFISDSAADIAFSVNTYNADRPVYMVRMNGKTVDKSAYSVESGKVVFRTSYLKTLDAGSKKLEFFFEGNRIVAYLTVGE